jgi:hypothetical protein
VRAVWEGNSTLSRLSPRLGNHCSRGRRFFGEQEFLEHLLDFVFLRESPGLFLRKDEFSVQLNFEDATGTWIEENPARDLFVKIMEHIFRQTGGTLEITSRSAIRYAHRCVLCSHHNLS